MHARICGSFDFLLIENKVFTSKQNTDAGTLMLH